MAPFTLSSFLILLCISIAVGQSLTLNNTITTTNNTGIPNPYSTPNRVLCYEQGKHHVPITIADCRALFNSLKSYPNYRRVQPFIEGRMPVLPNKRPGTPPYMWHDENTFCTVEIRVNDTKVTDKFSFEQARGLAIDILQDCEHTGGLGGEAIIGENQEGWYVRTLGIKLDSAVSDGTAMFEDARQSSGTLMAGFSSTVQTSKE